ncbi:MAG: hypothetical protein ACLU5J_09090 [Christensenellales bacterium]
MGTSYSNIALYLNNGSIQSRSLSYETKNAQVDTNNTYCGGFIGDFRGPNATMHNIKMDGYDFKNPKTNGDNNENRIHSKHYSGEEIIEEKTILVV